MGNTWDAVDELMVVLLRYSSCGQNGWITKTTILPADLGTILDPEDYSSAPVPKIPER